MAWREASLIRAKSKQSADVTLLLSRHIPKK
jgi:hypothetical protein